MLPRRRSRCLLAFAVTLAACASGEPRYHVGGRLVEHLVDGTSDASAGSHCAVADQQRRALGCTPWRPRTMAKITRTGVHPPLRFATRPDERDRPLVLKTEWKPPGRLPMVRGVQAPSVTVSPGGMATVTIPRFPPAELPEGTFVRVWSRPPPPADYRTEPVAIDPGAVLAVGIALDPATPIVGVAAVEFVITADAGDGPREILRRTVQATAFADAKWEDHRIALGNVEGPATRFHFATRVRALPGTSRSETVVVPLWGAPEVLVPAPDDERPNVVLVSLDTLRGDHVGALGCELPLTPRIDALAADGVVFEHASTTFPSTTGAHASMLTGRYPIRLGIFDPSRHMRASERTLAETMAAAGWRTAAVTEAGMLARAVGFERGFSRYFENLEPEPRTPPSYKFGHTMDAALEWIEQDRHDRFFLFLHTYAVHFPYSAPIEYRLPTWRDGAVERPIEEAPPGVALRYQYAADVRYADAQIGRLVDAIERLGLARDTIVVITSDHGEEFGEHGGVGHSQTLYEEVMHVPVVVWGPGRVPAGRRIQTPVSLVDLPPTILDLAGISPLAETDIDGQSQVARIHDGREDVDRVVFGEVATIPGRHERQHVARTGTMKWILTQSTPPELVAYDLVADPAEQRPLDDPALLARGRALLDRYDALAAQATAPLEVPIDETTREQLRELGYVE